ncbi:MAG: glycosyltransferase, partial [Oscillospiraceae bacterium]|nr:glycosyltransferase [Oscillospiraceae bacterium]
PEIIKEYEEKDSRIRSIRHPKNMYLPQALNTGFEAAKGELFTWTSDDNIYLPGAIYKMVEVLENKEIDIVYCKYTLIDDNGFNISKTLYFGMSYEIPVVCCIGACFMFRKNVFFDVGGYEDKWFLVEDWQFWIKAYNKGFNFKKIDDVYYLYRDNSKSLTFKKNSKIQLKSLELSLDNLEINGKSYSDEINMRAYLKCVGFAYRIPDKSLGKKCLLYAQKVNPDALLYLKSEIKEWLENSYTPLVSIILPIYNGSKFMRESIDSILSQTYTNWELIIVDDCSTDDTPEIIKEYEEKDSRIRSIRHPKNMYLPQALNTGFEAAKGELFTWTSDDNIYLPGAIYKMVEVLENKEIDIVYGPEQPIDEVGNPITTMKDYIFDTDSIPVCSAIGGHFLFRKNVFFDVGGYEDKWFLVEDWQFWIKAYNKGFNFKKIDDCNYLYRISSISLSKTKYEKIRIKALKLSKENCEQNKNKYPIEILVRAYLKQIRRCLELNDKVEALKWYKKAKQLDINANKKLNPELLEWIMEV